MSSSQFTRSPKSGILKEVSGNLLFVVVGFSQNKLERGNTFETLANVEKCSNRKVSKYLVLKGSKKFAALSTPQNNPYIL